MPAAALCIERAGWATTIQDQGRPGWAHLGVSPSGAVDPELAALVNRAVGNPRNLAVIETAGGLEIRARGALVVASSRDAAPTALRSGHRLRVDHDPERTFHYLAVRGGLQIQPVLGSVSQDTLGGLGPAPLRDGDEVPVGSEERCSPPSDLLVVPRPTDCVRLWRGPRLSWFDEDTFELLCAAEWSPSPQISRIGIRLDGPRLRRCRSDELPSEGLTRGAFQVPRDGRPVVMSADHPTTGGYPVVAIADPRDAVAIAQCPPGARIRFVEATIDPRGSQH